MPNFILTRSSVIVCPHGAPVTHVPRTNLHATVNGEMLLFPGDLYMVAGCPFSTPGGASPCYRVVWSNASKNFRAGGEAVLTSASIGIVQSIQSAPQGTASVLSHQTIVTD